MTTVQGAPSASAGGVPAPTDDHAHGTNGGNASHRKRGTKPCLPCADANARYQRAFRILHGLRKTVHVRVELLGALLDGGDPLVLLVEEFGAEVVDAIEMRAAKERRVR